MEFRRRIKRTNIHLWEFQKKRERNRKLIFKIMTENIPSLDRDMAMQIHAAQSSLNKFNPKRTTLRYIIIQLPKDKTKREL